MDKKQLGELWSVVHELYYSIPNSRRRQGYGLAEMNTFYCTMEDLARKHNLDVPEVPKE